MQLSFRFDKRPDESHLALDGKKTGNLPVCPPLPGRSSPRVSSLGSLTDCPEALLYWYTFVSADGMCWYTWTAVHLECQRAPPSCHIPVFLLSCLHVSGFLDDTKDSPRRAASYVSRPSEESLRYSHLP